MKILITNTFEKNVKRLNRTQINPVEDIIERIAKNPEIGDTKKGDLAGVRAYKFKMHSQLILLAYLYEQSKKEITLLSLGRHENFYRDLKKK